MTRGRSSLQLPPALSQPHRYIGLAHTVSDYHVFCDEAFTDGFQYRVQGGVWVNHRGFSVVRSALAKVRAEHPKVREFKWSSIRGKRPRRSYHDLVKVFFEGPAANHLAFKCLVVHKDDDSSQVLDSHGRDLGFYKAYHLLLKYRLEEGCRYRIRLDKRTGPRPNAEQQVAECLNAECCHWTPPAEVLSCVGLESHMDDLMQLADVLCGAVGWEWNCRPSVAPAKVALAEYVARQLRWKDMKRETAGSAAKFNVWRYRPKKK